MKDKKEEKKKKEKLRAKRKKRLKRFLLVVVTALIVAFAARVLSEKGENLSATGLYLPVGKEVEKLGVKVLGSAVRLLPGAPSQEEMGEVIGEEIDADRSASETSEPIKKPVENIRQQTELLLEMFRALPQDQLEAVKKQIYKDFCQPLLEEDRGE